MYATSEYVVQQMSAVVRTQGNTNTSKLTETIHPWLISDKEMRSRRIFGKRVYLAFSHSDDICLGLLRYYQMLPCCWLLFGFHTVGTEWLS